LLWFKLIDVEGNSIEQKGKAKGIRQRNSYAIRCPLF